MTSMEIIGASAWEQKLYDHLVNHVENERDLLVAYQQAAAESHSEAFRYLAALIIEEELRHHRMFSELADSLRTDVEVRPEHPAVPRLDRWGADPEYLVELTEKLLEREHQDAAELRGLSKDLRDLKDTTLWQLLVRLMEADTQKHIEILSFVRKHARQALP